MDAQAKLEQLRKDVLKEAYARREARLNELKREKAKYIKEMQEEVLSGTRKYIADEERNLERLAKRERSAWEFDAMKRLRLRRLEIEEQVMAELKERLLAFVRSEDYEGYLREKLRQTDLSPFTKKTVALCGTDYEREMRVLKEFLPAIQMVQDDTVEIGGFRLRDEERQIMADFTLDKKLEEARREFLNVAQLK